MLVELFKDFSWRDVLDILIVSFIIYRIILLIKGTRAVPMLKGFAIVFLFYILAEWVELAILHWILTNVLGSLILIIIVIFQHDIRRALAHVGTVPFFSSAETVDEEVVLDELMKAALALANKKIGALMVLEREIGLKDYVDIGTRLDAAVNKEMLQSIFLPNSPLHDGAVIIREGRLIAAGALLPLTANPVEKALGTRHRAAIGLTEETDAVVVVVSEERGRISLVEGGRIFKDMESDSLRKTLAAHLKTKKKRMTFA